MNLKKTNLGKWRFETQTYAEHTETVWVFRQLFLSPFFKYLSQLLSPEEVQETRSDIDKVLKLETIYHDYDKLFVPEERVKDMLKFHWHANLSAPENEPALEALLAELEQDGEVEWDKSLISRTQLKSLLQNANVCHNGNFTDEKWRLARNTYERFFSENERFKWTFAQEEWNQLTNWLAYSIRVADAVASAKEESAAFKTDVSKFTEFLRLGMPEAKIAVFSVHLNTVFSESSSASVLQGYYTLYNTFFVSLAELLKTEGVLIFDSANTIVGIRLSEEDPAAFLGSIRDKVAEKLLRDIKPIIDKQTEKLDVSLSKAKTDNQRASIFKKKNQLDEFDRRLSNRAELEDFVKPILQVKTKTIDCLSRVVDYDELLKHQLIESIYDSFTSDIRKTGLPCSSCGRNVISEGAKSDKLNQAIQNENTSLEGRGDFGSLRTIGRNIFQTTSLDKSDIFICPDCCFLSDISGGRFAQTTVAIGHIKRNYQASAPSLGLTNDIISELPKLVYSFIVKQRLIEEINKHVSIDNPSKQLIAKSFVILNYTTTPEKIFSDFVEPLHQCLRDIHTPLPDGQVHYSADFGVRIGTGAMLFNKSVIDNEFLKCALNFEDYYEMFRVAYELNERIRNIGSQEKENGLLLTLMNRSNLIALTKQILDVDINFANRKNLNRMNPTLTLDQLFDIAGYIQAHPKSVEWLRTIRNAEKIK